MKLIKRDESKPIITVTPDEVEQRRLQMRAELDEMDFKIAKSNRERELRKTEGVGAKIKDSLDELGRALDGFGDMGLKEDNISNKPKFIKSIDDLATFK